MMRTSLAGGLVVVGLAVAGVVGCASQDQSNKEPEVAPAPASTPAAAAPAPTAAAPAADTLASDQRQFVDLSAFGPVYFGFDSDVLTGESQTTLQKVADHLRDNRQVAVTIE